ncbi:MAG: hypothetical protein LBK99_26480 [Opitutaceae bacterium]|nr:hypothetical protein [Opitutaceae bacterium]
MHTSIHTAIHGRFLPAALGAIALFATIAIPTTAKAILIDFESASGYSTGSIINQTQTGTTHAWRGQTAGTPNANILQVTSDGSGGQLLKANNIADASGGPFFIFDTTAADLGETAGNTFSTDSSLVLFAFRFRFDDTLSATSSTAFRFGIGSTGGVILQLEALTTGQINCSNGAGNFRIQTSGNTNFVATTGAWITVSGRIDYKTKTLTLAVNDVNQNGGESITFKSGYSDSLPNISIRDHASGTTGFVGYSIDNISLALTTAAIPEPATTAATAAIVTLAIPVVVIAGRLIRRRRR